jgi:hypothetical protein
MVSRMVRYFSSLTRSCVSVDTAALDLTDQAVVGLLQFKGSLLD